MATKKTYTKTTPGGVETMTETSSGAVADTVTSTTTELLISPNGTQWHITVDNAGVLTATEV